MAKIKRKELGKGLQALLSNMDEEKELAAPSSQDEKEDGDQLMFQIPIEKIEVNPDQPRSDFDEDAIRELSQSIQTHGIIQPITIRRLRSEEHTSELQSRGHLVCRLLLEKKKSTRTTRLN